MKLSTLKPRIQTLDTRRVPTLNPGSWRTEKQHAASRGYGWKWQKARLRFLASNPLCVQCECEGFVRAATVVDHTTPHRGNQELFWDESNWQAMCKPHHDAKTRAGE